MRYRVLLSDVGNVIAPFFLDRFTEELGRLLGLPAATIDRILYHEMAGVFSVGSQACRGIHRGILTGEVTPEAYFVEIQRRFNCSISDTQFWRAFRDVFVINRPLVELWNRLRRSSAVERIVLVTDADPIRLEHALRLADFTPDMTVASYAVGKLKPDEAMFRHALHMAEAEPGQCIFVDDVDENVRAARELGIESYRFLYPTLGMDDATAILVEEFRQVGLRV